MPLSWTPARLIALPFSIRGGLAPILDGAIIPFIGHATASGTANAVRPRAGRLVRIAAATGDVADEFDVRVSRVSDGTVLGTLSVTPAALSSGTTPTMLGAVSNYPAGDQLQVTAVNSVAPGVDFTFGDITVTVEVAED